MMRARSQRSRIVWSSLMCLGLAMFIWMKLKVVSSVPRTAYAQPPAAQPEPGPAK